VNENGIIYVNQLTPHIQIRNTNNLQDGKTWTNRSLLGTERFCSDKIIKDDLFAHIMPFVFCPKCGSQLEIIDESDDANLEKKALHCHKCGFKKIYGT
jgi:predicted RNA-binding Zn-ribbon protein involved in translation (DUF1610 family)